jgi:hypothetical protein
MKKKDKKINKFYVTKVFYPSDKKYLIPETRANGSKANRQGPKATFVLCK